MKTEPTEYRNWWRVFDDPVLDQLIARAYRENLSLKIAGVRVLEARAQRGIATGGLHPQTQQAFGSLKYNRVSERAPQALFSSNLNYWQSERRIPVPDTRGIGKNQRHSQKDPRNLQLGNHRGLFDLGWSQRLQYFDDICRLSGLGEARQSSELGQDRIQHQPRAFRTPGSLCFLY